MTHIQVDVGVPGEDEARRIARTLVEERLVAGTRISSGPSHYWWDDAVQEHEYWTVTAFTVEERWDDLRDRVADLHSDDLPGITYTDIDGTEEFLAWITEETR